MQTSCVLSRFNFVFSAVVAIIFSMTSVPFAHAGGSRPNPDPETYIFYDSEPGSWVGAGEIEKLSADRDDFDVSFNYGEKNRGIRVRYAGWHFAIDAKGDRPIERGVYEDAMRFPFNHWDGKSGLNFSGHGRGCNTLEGRFVVLEVGYKPVDPEVRDLDEITSLAVDFEYKCPSGSSIHNTKIKGSIRYNQQEPYAVLEIIPAPSPTPVPTPVASFCGDGIVNIGEQCDDANTENGDGCSNGCRVEYCGDALLQHGIGEECDDANTINGDGCSSTCQAEYCGDGKVQHGLGEECDDGNSNHFDGCSSCLITPYCGDGIVDPGEQCDDGNADNTDECNTECQVTI